MSDTLSMQSPRARSGPAYGFAPPMVMVLNPASPKADGIRGLRTHVMAQHASRGRRALAICAANAGVGCSMVAANLAAALAQIGVKTLLVDADLRDPAIGKLIQPPSHTNGLVDYLQSPELPPGSNIQGAVLPNLSVMYAGQSTAHPRELLAGERFKALMSFCLREFDMTIVDTPPSNLSTDARIVSGVLGYSVIVAGENQTFVKDVKTLVSELRADGASPIGTVLCQA